MIDCQKSQNNPFILGEKIRFRNKFAKWCSSLARECTSFPSTMNHCISVICWPMRSNFEFPAVEAMTAYFSPSQALGIGAEVDKRVQSFLFFWIGPSTLDHCYFWCQASGIGDPCNWNLVDVLIVNILEVDYLESVYFCDKKQDENSYNLLTLYGFIWSAL